MLARLAKTRFLGAARRSIATQQPLLTNIEQRWTKMIEAEQGVVADHLATLEAQPWTQLTLEQKRAIYFVAYGGYGAREPADPAFARKVFGWVASITALAAVTWVMFTRQAPVLRTTTPEWRAREQEKQIEDKMNPYSGPYAKVLLAESQKK